MALETELLALLESAEREKRLPIVLLLDDKPGEFVRPQLYSPLPPDKAYELLIRCMGSISPVLAPYVGEAITRFRRDWPNIGE